MTLLDCRRDRAADAEAVAAHDHRLALAFFVEVIAVHRLGVFRAELEHVTDFDAAMDLQLGAAPRTRIAREDGGEIAVLRLRKIAAGIRAAEMRVLLVAADDPVCATFQRRVREHAQTLRADGTAVADRTASRRFEIRVAEHLEHGDAEVVLDLDFVAFAVAADQHHHRAVFGLEDERLHELRRRLVEEAADVIDRLRARRVDRRELFERGGNFRGVVEKA